MLQWYNIFYPKQCEHILNPSFLHANPPNPSLTSFYLITRSGFLHFRKGAFYRISLSIPTSFLPLISTSNPYYNPRFLPFPNPNPSPIKYYPRYLSICFHSRCFQDSCQIWYVVIGFDVSSELLFWCASSHYCLILSQIFTPFHPDSYPLPTAFPSPIQPPFPHYNYRCYQVSCQIWYVFIGFVATGWVTILMCVISFYIVPQVYDISSHETS